MDERLDCCRRYLTLVGVVAIVAGERIRRCRPQSQSSDGVVLDTVDVAAVDSDSAAVDAAVVVAVDAAVAAPDAIVAGGGMRRCSRQSLSSDGGGVDTGGAAAVETDTDSAAADAPVAADAAAPVGAPVAGGMADCDGVRGRHPRRSP